MPKRKVPPKRKVSAFPAAPQEAEEATKEKKEEDEINYNAATED